MQVQTTLTDYLTIDEIKAQFVSEWVVLDEPSVDSQQRVSGGRVVCHGISRDEVYLSARGHESRELAFLYTGEIPDGCTVVL